MSAKPKLGTPTHHKKGPREGCEGEVRFSQLSSLDRHIPNGMASDRNTGAYWRDRRR